MCQKERYFPLGQVKMVGLRSICLLLEYDYKYTDILNTVQQQDNNYLLSCSWEEVTNLPVVICMHDYFVFNLSRYLPAVWSIVIYNRIAWHWTWQDQERSEPSLPLYETCRRVANIEMCHRNYSKSCETIKEIYVWLVKRPAAPIF